MTRETTLRQRRAIIDAVNKYMEDHPEDSIGKAYETVGKRFFKSPFTIRDICNYSNGLTHEKL